MREPEAEAVGRLCAVEGSISRPGAALAALGDEDVSAAALRARLDGEQLADRRRGLESRGQAVQAQRERAKLGASNPSQLSSAHLGFQNCYCESRWRLGRARRSHRINYSTWRVHRLFSVELRGARCDDGMEQRAAGAAKVAGSGAWGT